MFSVLHCSKPIKRSKTPFEWTFLTRRTVILKFSARKKIHDEKTNIFIFNDFISNQNIIYISIFILLVNIRSITIKVVILHFVILFYVGSFKLWCTINRYQHISFSHTSDATIIWYIISNKFSSFLTCNTSLTSIFKRVLSQKY